MAKDIKKMQKKKELPPIVKKPSDPAALFRPKAEQLAINRKRKEALKKADEAYKKAMAETVEADPKDSDLARTETMIIQQKQLLKTLIQKRNEESKELDEAETGDKRVIKMAIGKINKKIEGAENRIAQLQDEVEASK